MTAKTEPVVDLVVQPAALSPMVDSPLPVYTGAQMAQALTAYRELQAALDKSMPDQIMELDGRPFRKKGYWRAIAVAFGLKVEPVAERRESSGYFVDGRENFGYVVEYRATAPNGRSVGGDGSCFAVEKARRFKCPHPERPGSRRTLHFPHSACPDYDPEYRWRVLPQEATEHNVRSHAHTRAFNRAVSNLVGFGEVSAEEVERDVEREEPHANGATAPSSPIGTEAANRAGAGPAPYAPTPTQRSAPAPASSGPVRVISEPQAKRFYAIAMGAGWTADELRAWLKREYGLASDRDVPRSQYEEIVRRVQAGTEGLV